MRDAIDIPNWAANKFEVEPGPRSLSELRILNAFVGPNNVGKSRLLRSLFESLCENVGRDSQQSEQLIYIPALRGMRSIGERDEYRIRTIKDYFAITESLSTEFKQDVPNTVEIVTGHSLAAVLRRLYLGNHHERRMLRQYESLLSNKLFCGDIVELVPRDKHGAISIKIGHEKERRLDQLGDGVGQLIILTLPLILYQDRQLTLFIEEPELFLHPGLQRSLINTLVDSSILGDRQIFVSTHSSQFLDISLESETCAIFRVRKSLTPKPHGHGAVTVNIANVGIGYRHLLDDLGSLPSSMMLSNCTIWVEGITDRLYFRHFIQLAMAKLRNASAGVSIKPFVENLHFSFFEYGGSNITHWTFLDEEEGIPVSTLCAPLFLIADRDENKESRHEKLRRSLGSRFYLLDVIEVENLLSPAVISAVVSEYEGSQHLKEFNQADYESERLGTFIQERVLLSASKRKGAPPYSEKSGTLKGKLDFCRRAIRHMNSYDSLSASAEAVVEAIITFIRFHNACDFRMGSTEESASTHPSRSR